MILVSLLIGAILIVAAIRDSQGELFAALKQDVPAFVVWAAAIVALGAIGWVPGLKPISRGLLGLVILVIVLRNYKQIIAGLEAVAQPPAASAPVSTGGSGLGAASPAPVAGPNPVTSVSPPNVNAIFGNLNDAVNAFGGGSAP